MSTILLLQKGSDKDNNEGEDDEEESDGDSADLSKYQLWESEGEQATSKAGKLLEYMQEENDLLLILFTSNASITSILYCL